MNEELPLELLFLYVMDIRRAVFDVSGPNCIVSANIVIPQEKITFVFDNHGVSSIDGKVDISESAAALFHPLMLLGRHLRDFLTFFA